MTKPGFGPAPDMSDDMPRLAGVWGEPTLSGPFTITDPDGYSYAVPEDATVRFVTGSRTAFVHVAVGRDKFVFARGMQQLAQGAAQTMRYNVGP